MRIQILSDIHLEFHHDGGRSFIADLDPEGVDVLVLAGDICAWHQLEATLPDFCDRYPEVVYVYGNHELYGASFPHVRGLVGRLESSVENLHILDSALLEIGGVRFVGTTLWFPFRSDNIAYERNISDFQRIDGLRAHVYDEHERATRFLVDNVHKGDVVITHHLPTFRSVPPRYKSDPLTRFFVSPMDDLIRHRRPALWVHGHSHDSADYLHGDTRVVCNPFGYIGYELNERFVEKMVVEVGG